MKHLLIIILFTLQWTLVVAQDLEFSDIIGTYEGEKLSKIEGDYQLRINADKTFVFSAKSSGVWVGIITGNLSKKDFFLTEDGGVTYKFDITDSPQNYNSLIVGLMTEANKSRLKVDGIFISLNKKDELPQLLDMNRKGGNPKIKSSTQTQDIGQEYKGSTQKWGNFKTLHDPIKNRGGVIYDKVKNGFLYQKTGNTFAFEATFAGEVSARFKYIYDKEKQQLKLVAAPTFNKRFFDTKKVNYQINTGQKVANEKEVYIKLGDLIYDLFEDKYKPTVTSNSITKTVFLKNGNAYVGEFLNDKIHGKGIFYNSVETHKGTWKDGEYHGKFELTFENGISTAYFENDKKVGTWRINYFDGGIKEVVFENDKEVSQKTIKASPKKELNPKMQTYFADFIADLSDPQKLKIFVDGQFSKMEKSIDKGSPTLRSFQLMMRPIKYKIDAHLAGLNASGKHLDQMIEEAELVGCDETLLILKKMNEAFNKMQKGYINARYHFNEQEFTKDNSVFKNHTSKGLKKLDDGIVGYNDLAAYTNSFSSFPCYKTKIVNPKPKPIEKKVYNVGIYVSDNETYTQVVVSNVSGVAEKAGIAKGDKLIDLNGMSIGTMGGRVAHNWLKSTDANKEYKLKYFDVSANENVTVYLKPSTGEYKELKREKVSNYIENAEWGDKKYTGELYLDMPHGKGKITFPNGNVYEGDLDQGEMTGQGAMTYADGSVYEGGWFSNQKDGKSVFTTAEGVEHHGTYKRGRKSKHFYVVDKNDNIVMEYYDSDNNKLLFTKKKTLAEAAKYIGREVEKPKPTPVKKETEYEPAEMPVFTGKYEGNDLVLLMGRHINDPAIQKWLNDGFTKSINCDNDFCIYRKAGLRLEFNKSHLSEMNLYQDAKGSFTGDLPQNLMFDASISTLSNTSVNWTSKTNEMYPHKYYYKNGVKVICYFDEKTSSKIKSFKLTKKIVTNPKGDKVGVGLVVRDDRYGKFSVSNTHHGWAAKKAGMYEGMQILEVDGQPVKDKGKYGIESMLKGKVGTTVTVKFAPRNQPNKWKIYELTRGANGKTKKISDYQSANSTSNSSNNTNSSNTNNSAEQVGIGISYMKGKDSDIYEITWLSSSSAAYKAGVRRFDDLTKVNGINISSKSSSEIKNLLKGNKGTSVKVTVKRDGKEMEFTVVR